MKFVLLSQTFRIHTSFFSARTDDRPGTLAPYASTYKRPSDSIKSNGAPIQLTLSHSPSEEDELVQSMEWEEIVPNSQDVLDAVRNLREGDEFAAMEVDLPWELSGTSGTGGWKQGGDGIMVVVGECLRLM